MSWLDDLLNSSMIVYILLILFGISFYLKKTGKTFPEMIRGIIDTVNSFKEEKVENVRK